MSTELKENREWQSDKTQYDYPKIGDLLYDGGYNCNG